MTSRANSIAPGRSFCHEIPRMRILWSVRSVIWITVVVSVLCLGLLGLHRYRVFSVTRETRVSKHGIAQNARNVSQTSGIRGPLPALDANGHDGIEEISKTELVRRITKLRPLSPSESANLNRGCPGLTCLYQGLGLGKWPESARGTVAYLTRESAVQRSCPSGQENFVFVKQGWWLGGRPPKLDPATNEVSLDSVTRIKPGFYTFNYAVYFPSTGTYAWMNHREYGFPVNLFKPQRAYLSLVPPPLDESRTAQVYCSTCR